MLLFHGRGKNKQEFKMLRKYNLEKNREKNKFFGQSRYLNAK